MKMVLNKPSGNMYPFAYTWNPIGGKCHHECIYCYVKDLRKRGIKKYFGKPYLDEKAFKDKLVIPDGYIVFVQSCGDLFGYWIDTAWIWRVLNYLKQFPKTTFLLQSKNPERFLDFNIPQNCILGTTIETNRDYNLTKAPTPKERYHTFYLLSHNSLETLMLSIEPVLDFDLETFASWLIELRLKFVSLGANSSRNNLPEPCPEKLQELIEILKKRFRDVRLKKNINRLLRGKG